MMIITATIGFAKQSVTLSQSVTLNNVEALSVNAEYPDCPDCLSPYDLPNAYLASEVSKMNLTCKVEGKLSYENKTLSGPFKADGVYAVIYERLYCKEVKKCVCCDVYKQKTTLDKGDVSHPIISHGFDMEDSFAKVTAMGTICNLDDSLKLIVKPYDMSLYLLNENTLDLKKFVAILYDKEMPHIPFCSYFEKFNEMVNKTSLKFPRLVAKSNNWIIIVYSQNTLIWNYKYDKGYDSLNGMVYSDLDAFPFLSWNIVYSSDKEGFLSWIEPEQLIEIVNANKECLLGQLSQQMVNALDTYGNPIIIRYRLKS